MVYNGASHFYDVHKGATLAAVFLCLENELNLPNLDTMRFTMGNIDVDKMPGDTLVSNIFSENAALSITDKSLVEGNTVRISLFTIDAVPLHSNPYFFIKNMRVTVVYKGASHAYNINKRATLAAAFLCLENELNLPRLDKMRFTIAGRDNIDVGELPGDALVSSVFFENAVLSITEMFKNPIRNMLENAARNPIRTLETVSTIIGVLSMI